MEATRTAVWILRQAEEPERDVIARSLAAYFTFVANLKSSSEIATRYLRHCKKPVKWKCHDASRIASYCFHFRCHDPDPL